MKEFGVYNTITNENTIIFGYNEMDAFKRNGMNANEWIIEYVEYID